jgi:copper(I)-binding protein
VTLLRPAAATLALALTLAALSGCKQETAKRDRVPGDAASVAAEASPISDARLILPAVKGNPAAAYFAIKNDTSGTMSISSIAIDGIGKTEVHQTIGTEMTQVDRVDIAPGTSIAFEPGQLHVMAFDVANTLKAGNTTQMTVSFAAGGKATSTMKIEAAGAAAMGEMDHGEGH